MIYFTQLAKHLLTPIFGPQTSISQETHMNMSYLQLNTQQNTDL